MQQGRLIFSFLVLVLSIGITAAQPCFCPFIECFPVDCVYPEVYEFPCDGPCCCGCGYCVAYASFGQLCKPVVSGLAPPPPKLTCGYGLECVNKKCQYDLLTLFENWIVDTV